MSADLSDFDPDSTALIPNSKFAIFILSTYGEGDPSDNANQFWSWVTKNVSAGRLETLRYAAFGLGNSNYSHYNRVVDVVDQSLQDMSAKRLLPVGKADDATGATQEDFSRWKDDLFAFLQGLGYEEHEQKYEATLSTVFDESLTPIDLHNGEPVHPGGGNSNESAIKPVKVSTARELFTTTKRNCLHLDIDLVENPELVYKTGDHLGIWSMNPDAEVERLLRCLGLSESRDTPISLSVLDPSVKLQVPTPTTLTALFRYYLEISAPVSRDMVRSIAQFAPTPEAKDWLQNLSSGEKLYSSFMARNHVNLGRLLDLAVGSTVGGAWSGLPLPFLIESLPRMRPRYYSISSSSVLSPRTASITAIVSNTTIFDKDNKEIVVPGLATSYLLSQSHATHDVAVAPDHPKDLAYELSGPTNALKGGRVFAHLRRSTFKLPTLSSRPLIMLAAGTGIAPFRAFIAERARLLSMGREVGEMILFYGCRHPDEDYIYREELETFKVALGENLKIVMAFSRQEKDKRVYIQDKMREYSEDIVRLNEEGPAVYACGRASMAREAGEVLGEIVGRKEAWPPEKISDWISDMKKTRRWQEDVWG